MNHIATVYSDDSIALAVIIFNPALIAAIDLNALSSWTLARPSEISAAALRRSHAEQMDWFDLDPPLLTNRHKAHFSELHCSLLPHGGGIVNSELIGRHFLQTCNLVLACSKILDVFLFLDSTQLIGSRLVL